MIPADDSRALRAGLLAALPILLILALGTLLLWPSPASLLRYWSEILDYQHGYLIAAIVVTWIGRELWGGAARGSRPSWIAACLLAVALSAWIVAVRGSIEILHQLLWPVLLGLSVWAVAGPHAARRVVPAIGLLYAAIPVWDYGMPVLQRLSIFFSEHILVLLGVPATVSEYHVTIPEGTFGIVEGCSGKRYFVVTLAVAYLAIAINHLRGWRVVLFLGFSALLSLLMNWIRIVIVIYAGHVSNMESYLVVNEHKTLGNALFVVLIAAVLLAGRWLSPAPARAAPADSPGVRDSRRAAIFHPAMLVPAMLLLAGLRASPVGASPVQALRVGGLPLATGVWQGPLPSQAGWQPQYLQPDDQRRVAYVSAQGAVEVYVNLYVDQRNGRELIKYVNNLVAPALWTEVWGGSGSLRAGGRSWAVREMEGPDHRHWTVAYSYLVRDRIYRSDLAAKLAYGWFSITGPTPAGVLAAAAPCDARNCDNARKLVADFWENMQLPMEAMMSAGTPVAP